MVVQRLHLASKTDKAAQNIPYCPSVFRLQGRNEVYGIRDQSPRDRDQRVFHGLKDQASRFCGIRDQNFHHFWDQGLKICVKIRDQRRKNIPRYDHAIKLNILLESTN